MKFTQQILRVSFLLVAAMTIPAITYAEKADRSKEIVIDAARNTADQAKNILVLEGMVDRKSVV